MTLPQTIRNYISRHTAADRAGICLYLSTCHGEAVRTVTEAIDALETAGDITRTECGRYVLTSHLRYQIPLAAPADLVLTSTDPDFGQPRLF